jgi:CopG family transcriptional regulator / antitoxin EndoAI
MKTSTVNISFNSGLLGEIDRVAEQESRARSELIREAARMYIARKKQWDSICAFGRRQTKALKLTPADIQEAIRQHRRAKAKKA